MMGNCLAIIGLKKLKRSVTLLLVGLDNAGKTTAAKGIVGDSIENVAPTVGFCPETLEYRGCDITIYDLGGGSRIRDVWSKYFSEVHGIIFVIDSSDKNRVKECHSVLRDLLSHSKVSGKPVLILANKQDIEGALDEIDLVESLKIEEIVNTYKCPARVETCSAITIKKKKPEKTIADGFRWLIDTIVLHYADIDDRVKKDLEQEHKQQQAEVDKRRMRLKKLREEQERREELSRLESIVDCAEESDEDIIIIQKRERKHSNCNVDTVTASKLIQDNPVLFHEKSIPNSPNTSSETQELLELGLTASNLIDASPSSSTSTASMSYCMTMKKGSASPLASDKSKSPQLILVQSSSSQAIPDHHEIFNNDKLNKPSEIIQNVCSFIDVHSYAELDCQGERYTSKECIPIDSDDEMFSNIKVPDNHIPSSSQNVSPNISNGSVTAGVKAQLELEASLNQKPKKKAYLKRLHKTAPLNTNSSNYVSAVTTS